MQTLKKGGETHLEERRRDRDREEICSCGVNNGAARVECTAACTVASHRRHDHSDIAHLMVLIKYERRSHQLVSQAPSHLIV